jgi:hypothetical protein
MSPSVMNLQLTKTNLESSLGDIFSQATSFKYATTDSAETIVLSYTLGINPVYGSEVNGTLVTVYLE